MLIRSFRQIYPIWISVLRRGTARGIARGMSCIFLMALLMGVRPGAAQTIQFSTYFSAGLNVTQEAQLEFGSVFQNHGPVQIDLGDVGMAVMSILGQADLDVIVTIDAPSFIEHASDPGSQIPLTIYAAYANRGRDSVIDAIPFNGSTTRFTIRGRDLGPPRPPPTPAHEGYAPPSELAYLYIYGVLDVGTVISGEYLGEIHISVVYD